MQKSVYRYNDKSAVKVIAPVFVVEKKMWVFIYNDLYHMYQWGRYIALDGAKTAFYNQIGNLNNFFSSIQLSEAFLMHPNLFRTICCGSQ